MPYSLHELLNEGDVDFLSTVFLRYRSYIIHVARRVLRDTSLVEDVVSEVMIQVIKNLESCQNKNEEQLKSFLYTITRRRALNYQRDWQRGNPAVPLNELGEPEEQGRTIEETVADRVDAELLIKLIEGHDLQYAHMLQLRAIFDCSFEEISRMYNIDVEAARSRFYRGRRRIVFMLRRDGRFGRNVVKANLRNQRKCRK